MKRLKIDLTTLVFLTLFVNIPFLNQAFHIDDGLWLHMGEILREEPLHPFRKIDYNFFGERHTGNLTYLSHPPFIPYFLGLIIRLFGRTPEIIFHSIYLIFPILAVVANYFLARKFLERPLLASLFLLFTPSFMVMTHTIMTDVPLLAFWLSSIALYIYGVEKEKKKLLLMASLSMIISFSISYQGLFLIPLLSIYTLLSDKTLVTNVGAAVSGRPRAGTESRPYKFLPRCCPVTFWSAKYIFIPLGAFSLWIIVTWVINEEFLLFSIYSNLIRVTGKDVFINMSYLIRKAFSLLINIGGATLFPPLLVYSFMHDKREATIFSLIFLTSLLLAKGIGYPFIPAILFISFLSVGVFSLYKIVKYGVFCLFKREFLARNHGILLSIWFFGVIIYNLFLLPMGAVRYTLPLVPPLILMILIQAKEVSKKIGSKNENMIYFISLAFTFLIGILVAWADYELAGQYKTFSLSAKGRYKKELNRVWFVGDWGFRNYMEKEGYSYLLSQDNSPKGGDIIVIASLPYPHPIHPNLMKKMALITKERLMGRIPIRTMNSKAHAGFYSHNWGLLPYSFSKEYLDEIQVYRVVDLKDFDLSLAQIETLRESFVGSRYFNIGGDVRDVIFAHPPTKLKYKIKVPPRASLSFSIALDPNVWSPQKGDGVLFEIYIYHKGKEERLFSKYINPKWRIQDRKWHDFSIDLMEYGGKEVFISFVTKPGVQRNLLFDGAGWSNPRIIGE